MKIAFLTTTMFSKTNGPANFAVNLYNLSKRNPQEMEIDFITEDSKACKRVVNVTTKWSSILRPIGMVIKSIEYFKAINENYYDIKIWNFSVISWFTIFSSRSASKNVVFVNDKLSLDFTFNYTYSSIRYGIFRLFESYTCRNADRVITNSVVLKRKLVSNYNVSENKIKVLYKGITIPELNQVKTNWEIKRGAVIQLSFVKTNYVAGGLEMLCNALSELKDFVFEIKVVGPTKITNINLDFDNITISCLGKLNKGELFETIKQTDFFCVPCIEEAFGQANIEALALQIPTIILPTEIQLKIHSDDYCWFPDRCDISSLSKEISHLLESPSSYRKEKALIARQVMRNKYSFQTTFRKLKQILEYTIDEKF